MSLTRRSHVDHENRCRVTTTHKNWWECDTGIAYLVSFKKSEGWRSRGVKIYDLSDPTKPRYIRDFGLVGQEPGSKGEPVPQSLHGPIRLGNRVYFGYGSSAAGTLQIVDRINFSKATPIPKTHSLPRQKISCIRKFPGLNFILTPVPIRRFRCSGWQYRNSLRWRRGKAPISL